jgi:hypothetical protein
MESTRSQVALDHPEPWEFGNDLTIGFTLQALVWVAVFEIPDGCQPLFADVMIFSRSTVILERISRYIISIRFIEVLVNQPVYRPHLLCSNCHSMIHRFADFTPAQLRNVIDQQRAPIPAKAHNFIQDGSRILTASHDRAVRIWDSRTGKPLLDPIKLPEKDSSACFALDETFFVTESVGGGVFNKRDWQLSAGSLSRSRKRTESPFAALTLRDWAVVIKDLFPHFHLSLRPFLEVIGKSFLRFLDLHSFLHRLLYRY